MSESVANKIQDKVNEMEQNNKPARLEVDPLVFPKHTEGYITSTREITDRISEAFGVFRDYVGCRVYAYMLGMPIPQQIAQYMIPGNFYCDIYFEMANNPNNGGFPNLELINSHDKNARPLDILRSVCGGSSNTTTYRVNNETLDMISVFLPGYSPKGNSINPQWNLRIVEDSVLVNSYSPTQKVAVRVIGLDVDAIMGLIYGTQDEDAETDNEGNKPIRYDYHCIPLATSLQSRVNVVNNNLTTAEQMYNQEYVIQVLRNDRSIISAMQRAIGVAPNSFSNSYVPYNRNV